MTPASDSGAHTNRSVQNAMTVARVVKECMPSQFFFLFAAVKVDLMATEV